MKHLQINKIFYDVKKSAILPHCNSLSFVSLWVSTNVLHDRENNFLLKHKYDASSIGNSSGSGVHLTVLVLKNRFMPFNAEAKPLAFFLSLLPSRHGCS